MDKRQESKFAAVGGRLVNRATGEPIPDDEPVFDGAAMTEHRPSKTVACPHGYDAKYLCIACAYEHAKQLSAALQSFVDFQIGDYYRQADAAKRYCEIRRAAVEALGGRRRSDETSERPAAWCVEASHDGSLSPPVALRQDAVLHQQNMREQHPGVMWTLVPLYRSAVKASGEQT
jgi:hypothetical protein